ncbi:MAG: PilZ domain-containing protein [Thermoanaerobaculia bacterium]
MNSPRTRRVERVHLAQPLAARLGATQVILVDLSVMGARVEHHVPLIAGAYSQLTFRSDDVIFGIECRIVRSRLERFSAGSDGMTIYHSGLEFERLSQDMRTRLKQLIGSFIVRALEEQKLNARGVLPEHDVSKMPIFRFGGQLTANEKSMGGSALMPMSRVAKETGYICYGLEWNTWRRKRTHDPGQPMEGFTISANEDHEQVELLCEAYQKSDRDGRRLIQLCAQLSLMEEDGVIVAGRFEP